MRQMALYAGARLLIFAEGSAMHGRQLLGRVDQKILVLRRRPQSRMAWAQLEPRCRKLKYALIIKAFAMPLPPQGVPVHPYGIAFYNKDPLLNTLRRNGIDITPYWGEEAYRQAMKVDAHAWYRGVMRRRIIHRKKTLAHIRTAFDTAGIPVPSWRFAAPSAGPLQAPGAACAASFVPQYPGVRGRAPAAAPGKHPRGHHPRGKEKGRPLRSGPSSRYPSRDHPMLITRCSRKGRGWKPPPQRITSGSSTPRRRRPCGRPRGWRSAASPPSRSARSARP